MTPGPNGEANDITTTAVNILDYAGTSARTGATSIRIIAGSGNLGKVLVNIPSMHGADSWATLLAGEAEVFRFADGGLNHCNVKSDAGTQSIRWATVSLT